MMMNNRKLWILALVLLIVGLGLYFFKVNNTSPSEELIFNPNNATYLVGEESITMIDGKSESLSARIFDTKLGDINDDGLEDAVVIIVQDSEGSGTFYYVAAALSTDLGTQTTNAILLGDRIAPQTIEIIDKMINVNYVDRKIDDPFSTPPSIGITARFFVKDGILVPQH